MEAILTLWIIGAFIGGVYLGRAIELVRIQRLNRRYINVRY